MCFCHLRIIRHPTSPKRAAVLQCVVIDNHLRPFTLMHFIVLWMEDWGNCRYWTSSSGGKHQSSQNSHQRMPSPRPMWPCASNPFQPNTFDIFALYGRVALIGRFTFWEITSTASLGGVAQKCNYARLDMAFTYNGYFISISLIYRTVPYITSC